MPDTAGQAPLISVIIPAYNAERYLPQCLDSVLAQTLRSFEVIIVDDASTDRTAEILSRYRSADERVRLVSNPQNLGVAPTRNHGIDAARGDYLAFVDADDYVEPTMLEDLHRAAIRLDAEVVACGIRLVDPTGRELEVVEFPLPGDLRQDRSAVREVLHGAFGTKMLWYHVRNLYARPLIEDQHLRFDDGIRKGEDSLFNLHALCFADGVACIRRTLYSYRKHASSATANPLASECANIERLGQQVTALYKAQGFDARAYADFYGQVLRSDLPTALVRLRGHATQLSQTRELISANTVRQAFKNQSVVRLDAPARVKLLLILSRLRWARAIRVVVNRAG
ncbi:MAG: glycosyltransferase [Microthrixaceae bacterium]|nr:glycosyltransferase [Microthrixaceae bacterium]